jgi:hypothetical protein
MSAGSGASNLGYANISPLSNINGRYVNVDNSHSPANFGSNQIPGLPGLAGAKNNVDAAAGNVPGICLFKGGAKKLKRKIKNITKYYKMKGGSRKRNSIINKIKSRYASRSSARAMALAGGKRNSIRNKIKSRYASRSLARARAMALAGGKRKSRSHRHRRGGRTHRGGYSQYQNNLPMTPTYSVGGILPSNQLGLANPPPIQVLCNNGNCTDNYNHFTGKGFPSRGH